MHHSSKEFHQQKSKEHYAKYKQKYLERNAALNQHTISLFREAKKNGCLLCPEKEFYALDFHHLDPNEKDFYISKMRGRNDDLVWAEIRKCVVLCANCHRKHHAGLPEYCTEVLVEKSMALAPGIEPG